MMMMFGMTEVDDGRGSEMRRDGDEREREVKREREK
jgi:hypothetical protein